MVNENFIRERITQLRLRKNVSEYKMSLDLGHSKGYIQNIVSGRTLPSLNEFLYICEYLNVSLKDFFDEDIHYPVLVQKAVDGMKDMDDEDLIALIGIIERLNKKQNK